ncbi:hypothetical protein [Ancylobacter sp. IITR112]|uniref:phage tail assembly chaperone n=1 Tax=Ancylobacter sp. IITR112 TaxID=3138073 RepID=UPI00352B734D
MRSKPALTENLLPVWNAFWALSTDRQIGFGGVGPIQFSSVDRYAIRYGIDGIDEFDRFTSLIRAMDSAFLEQINRKREGAGGAV